LRRSHSFRRSLALIPGARFCGSCGALADPATAPASSPPGKRRAKLAIGAASAVAAVTIAAVAWVVTTSNGVRADSSGGLAADLPGLPFQIDAPPGTFEPGQARSGRHRPRGGWCA
jgi:hypothetical protein